VKFDETSKITQTGKKRNDVKQRAAEKRYILRGFSRQIIVNVAPKT
jgi:hypothetical protein